MSVEISPKMYGRPYKKPLGATVRAAAGAEVSRRGAQQTEGGRKLRFLVKQRATTQRYFYNRPIVYTKARVFRFDNDWRHKY